MCKKYCYNKKSYTKDNLVELLGGLKNFNEEYKKGKITIISTYGLSDIIL